MNTAEVNVSNSIEHVLAEIVRDYRPGFGGGQLTTSAYDTAWLARVRSPVDSAQLAFPDALEWLLQNQNPSGSWSGPFPHDILPTLSASVALGSLPDNLKHVCASPAARALAYLTACLSRWQVGIHESIGFEMQLPSLVRSLNKLDIQLDIPNYGDVIELMQAKLIRSSGDQLAAGRSSLIHSLEGFVGILDPEVVPRLRSPQGHYGHSPAATAAVLRQVGWDEQSALWLRELQARQNGGVPNVFAIDAFEAAWSLHFLLSVNPRLAESPLCDRIVRRLQNATDPVRGNSWAVEDYFPKDSDDTGLVLAVLAMAGKAVDSSVLLRFESTAGFVCWANERNASISANAHVLEAFILSRGDNLYRSQMAKATNFLLASRLPDGSWLDKWHASPFYAVFCASRSLALHPDPAIRGEILPSLGWLMAQQRADGSWGLWAGSAEETAYAILTLIHSKLPGTCEAMRRGQAWIEAHYADPRPELWIGKQLYSPIRVVEAAVLAALQAK
jgi:halimadienyl-diphosphate synthase